MDRQKKKEMYLFDPEKLRDKKPFYRGMGKAYGDTTGQTVAYNGTEKAELPDFSYTKVTQNRFARELDPNCHDVLYDTNVPSIFQRLNNGRVQEIKYSRMAVPYQEKILNKQVLHLCGNPMQFTLIDDEPTDNQKRDFTLFKQYWKKRNQDGMKTKLVTAQKSFGDGGLLYYYDYKGRIKCRILSYPDYILCPVNDDNGDRLLESVYYKDNDYQRIDCYDETYCYKYINNSKDNKEWDLEEVVTHGFSEIPLISKRGDVAWNNVQSNIETYEIIYNIYNVIQKRQGWGILFVKGNFEFKNEKVAGSVILQAKSSPMETNDASAEFKTPPTGEGMENAMELLDETIQKGAGTTFLLPKDIKSMGDISGLAIALTQSMDIETATQGAIEWQNVADKMTRLFKEGLAKELVNKGIHTTAVTDFENLNISAHFEVWKPKSETETVSNLIQAKGAGILSQQSAIEQNPYSKPDELARAKREEDEAEQKAKEAQQQATATEVIDVNNPTN